MAATNDITARTRLLLCLVIGVLAALATSALGHPKLALLIGWDMAAGLFAASILATVLRYDAATTKTHALRDNPGRGIGDVLVLAASVASLLAVGVVMVHASSMDGSEKILNIALGLCSLIVSWLIIHTTYMLTYTRLYYGKPEGGIGFNQQEPPSYVDFAYMAFTLGMTFQVSDTNVQTRQFRAAILRHALLAYTFGTVIIATAINLVVSLSQ